MEEPQVDWRVPDVGLSIDNEGDLRLSDLISNKRALIIGCPGAFLPTCTDRHVAGYRDFMPLLRKTVDCVVCLSVNDPWVMREWAKELDCPSDLLMVADWQGKLTASLGLEMDARAYNLGKRCRRFCMLLDQGVVIWFGLDDDAYIERLAVVLRHLDLITAGELEAVEKARSEFFVAPPSSAVNSPAGTSS